MAYTERFPDAGPDEEIDLDADPARYEPRRRGPQHAPRRRAQQSDPFDSEPSPDDDLTLETNFPASWTDPRFLVPLVLFLAAVFVIGLALRAGSLDEGASPAQDLVNRVVAAEQRAGFSNITVRAEGSLILLEGETSSATDAAAMAAVARSVEGVTSVDNRLVISGGALDEQVAATSTNPAVTETLSSRLDATGNVTFEPASASLTDEGVATVNSVAEILLGTAGINIEIHGHTDSDGDSDANQRLSQERADAVVSALIVRGVDATMLTAVGFGESKPIQPNITEEGRAENRRIEFHVIP